ncbi:MULTISPECIES: hypothetical protein [Pseudoalteromonas]|jgi:hypothetical protein|uniref:Uncharacterized protein n=1 Tax=Pseudoalteromonas lipolytica TaxID=570156 RepID=A0AAD0RZ92_9GAMM|nr:MULTISPECIES: hypothetical protein [Pseudoalteromonas]AXV65116.1 hypothetical protein D0907_07515 [Pseudoalteromonas donghaensis]EWH07253.1 hypothetical protein AT00_06075 [Pseudoalteromonas lipolytica SCSIO 04301]MAE01550.1 hypothetical protein [Pseudoalteromonas sp.]MCC9659872.1 hypothetical protein [Pseudoalteromonas sp. MB41]QLJ09621.1 hypothetical protein GZH31_07410 [Pseudoalteromonas sp. JSTW]|tara:strand:+ start:182 stop:577 length:396 start_codon:yes stop_codon:yes gene_type:complete
MKHRLAKSVGLSLLSPVIIGCVLGVYYALTLEGNGWRIFFNLFMNAIANAHIVGLTMAAFVVPGYLLMYKYAKVNYSGVLTLGLLGGAIFSYLLSATSGMAFIVNAIMSALAAGLFLFGLRQGLPSQTSHQ